MQTESRSRDHFSNKSNSEQCSLVGKLVLNIGTKNKKGVFIFIAEIKCACSDVAETPSVRTTEVNAGEPNDHTS